MRHADNYSQTSLFFYEQLFAFDFDLSFSIPYSWENVEAHVSHFLAQSNKGSL
jgi:hypothetical protein